MQNIDGRRSASLRATDDGRSALLRAVGRHLIAEYYGCDPALLDDLPWLCERLLEAARRCGATPLQHAFHRFSPHGVSGVVLIAESHLTIHTWPEHGYAAVDLFTCGAGVDPELAHQFLLGALRATSSDHHELRRGLFPAAQAAPRAALWRATPAGQGIHLQPASDANDGELWLGDRQGDELHAFAVRRVLHAGRTAFARAEIVDTPRCGKLLALDGLVQSSAADEAAYHEALVAPAFALCPTPIRRVAILGGGEGATLREVLRFPEVRACTMVDIDAELVALCRAHLPEWSAGAFDDPRADLRCGDARAFLERAAQHGDRYDLILCDLPEAEPTGPLRTLYSRPFFEFVRRCLTPTGVYAGQVGSLQTGAALLGPAAIVATARAALGPVRVYARYLPSYWGEWVFAIGGPGLATADHGEVAAAAIDGALAQRRAPEHPLRSYDGETHRHLFSLPRELRDALTAAPPPLED